jgi:hypothetical protein
MNHRADCRVVVHSVISKFLGVSVYVFSGLSSNEYDKIHFFRVTFEAIGIG